MSKLDGSHVSLDIEACGEIVLSIGACEFDIESGAPLREFYCVPSVEDQLARGLKADAGAFIWLLMQSDEMRRAITEHQAPAQAALESFAVWFPKGAWLWAYPTSFDLPVVQRAMHAFGLRPPWGWTKTLDGRTLWRLACAIDPGMEKIEKDANPAAHHALADAKEQAQWFARYLAPVLRGDTQGRTP